MNMTAGSSWKRRGLCRWRWWWSWGRDGLFLALRERFSGEVF
jgi:hypothetical protein